MNETEISHSRHIVSELLEALIDANQLDMELAEIEGDALLYYKYGAVPTVEELIEQCQKMFIEFHSHLLSYKHRRICNCGACSTAQDLTLKFITHKADFNFIKVKEHRKPHGSDVVLAHRLLKNDVPGKEYLLLTQGFFEDIEGDKLKSHYSWIETTNASSNYDDIGEVPYQYISLQALRNEVDVKPAIYPELSPNPIIAEGKVNLESKLLFELITNFDFRDQWNNDVLRIEYEQERVNRMGTRHVCVFDNENIEFETVSNDFGEGKMVYGERLRNYKFIKEATNYFILEDRGESTWLRIESHLKAKNFVIELFSFFYRTIFGKNLKKILGNIQGAANTFKARHLSEKLMAS